MSDKKICIDNINRFFKILESDFESISIDIDDFNARCDDFIQSLSTALEGENLNSEKHVAALIMLGKVGVLKIRAERKGIK